MLTISGNKIPDGHVKRLNIKFIDSSIINFTMCPLKDFPKILGFKSNKRFFSHLFNKKENRNYIDLVPKDLGYHTMKGLTKKQRIIK